MDYIYTFGFRVFQSLNILVKHGQWEVLELSKQSFGYAIDHVQAKKLDMACVSVGAAQVL
jgi:hypothetical protein